MTAEAIAVLPAGEFSEEWWAAHDTHGDFAIEVSAAAVREAAPAPPPADATPPADMPVAPLLTLFTGLLAITWRIVTRRPGFAGLFPPSAVFDEQQADVLRFSAGAPIRPARTHGSALCRYTATARIEMGFFSLLFPWGMILQALAIVHFIRRRPDTIWLWIIIFLGPIGALVYIFMEVVPDVGLLRQSFEGFGRRKRIRHLEAVILENPAAGNYEELADLYLDEGKFARARECYDKAISPRTVLPDAIYRRGVATVHLGDFAAAVPDLEHVVSRAPKYDLHRAIALLAHAYANTGQPERAEALFRQATGISTSSETYLNYATFLASQNRNAEARAWAERILAKKPTMPRYLQRRERPWFRKAKALLKRLPKS